MALHNSLYRFLRIAAVGLLTLGFMFATKPSELPAVLLVVPFVRFGYRRIGEIGSFLGPDEDEHGAIVRLRRPRLLTAASAGFPVLLLVLQSAVRLTVWDMLIALAIFLLVYLYMSRSAVSF